MNPFYIILGAGVFFLSALVVAYFDRRFGHGHRSDPRTESLRKAEMEYLTRQNHM